MKKILAFIIGLLAFWYWLAVYEIQINPNTQNPNENISTIQNIQGSYQLEYFSSQWKKYSVWFPVFLNFWDKATFRLCTTYNWDYKYNDEILSANLVAKNTNWCNNIYRSSIQYSFTNEIQYNSKAWLDKDRLFVQTTKKIFVFKKI